MKKWKLIMAAVGAGLLGGVLASCGSEPKEARPVKTFQQGMIPDETGSSEPGDNKIQIYNPEIYESEIDGTENNVTEKDNTDVPKVELVALADTEEQAQEIASMYQIELQSFSNGVAVYTTDQEPSALIALGQQNGYPALSVNNRLELY